MSWDVDLAINTGKCLTTVVDIGNMTYNAAPMYYEALGGNGLRDLNDLIAEKAIPLLRSAISDMERDPDKYKSLNPPNGGWSYEGALDFLRSLLEGCEAHPKCSIHIY